MREYYDAQPLQVVQRHAAFAVAAKPLLLLIHNKDNVERDDCPFNFFPLDVLVTVFRRQRYDGVSEAERYCRDKDALEARYARETYGYARAAVERFNDELPGIDDGYAKCMLKWLRSRWGSGYTGAAEIRELEGLYARVRARGRYP